jgi:carbonic anhydrase
MEVLFIMFSLTFLMATINQIECFTYNTGNCGVLTRAQSPIDISSSTTSYAEEKYFRVLTNNYGLIPKSTNWVQFTDLKSVGFNVTSNSTIQIVKDWAIYQFYLRKVIFRSKSEHKIDGNSFDVEMQLFHDLDENFTSIGRQKSIPIKKLIISVFFQRPSTADDIPDNFFKVSNLAQFANGTASTFTNGIKLAQLIQNVPSFLYQGTNTNSDCEDTYWLIMSKYSIIANDDFLTLSKLLEQSQFKDLLTDSNGRNVNMFYNSNNVLRNFNNATRVLAEKSYFRYNSSEFLRLSIAIISFLIILLF